MFYKICNFENSTITNDVITKNNGKIWTSAKPDKLYIIRKVLSKNVLFIEFELPCKNLRAFLSNFGFFTMPAHQIWSCHVTQEANFEKFLLCPNFTFNIRKSHKISSGKALYFRSYQPKTSRGRGWKPPVPLGLTY